MPRGRPPKIAPVPYAVLKELEETSRRIGPACLPQSADLLGYTWIALTERIRRIAPGEYPLWRLIDTPSPPNIDHLKDMLLVGMNQFQFQGKYEYLHVREHVAVLSMLEALDEDLAMLKERHRLVNKVFKALIQDNASEANHLPATVSVQRDNLIHFLVREGCPLDMEPARQWVETAWPVLMTLLLKGSCRCGQPNRGYDGFAKTTETYTSLPSATLAELIVGHLHGIGLESVRALHKQA